MRLLEAKIGVKFMDDLLWWYSLFVFSMLFMNGYRAMAGAGILILGFILGYYYAILAWQI